MALIKCSECGKDISDKAHSCPNCGNPTNDLLKSPEKNKTKMETSQRKQGGLDKQKLKDAAKKYFTKKNISIIAGIVAVLIIGTMATYAIAGEKIDISHANQLISQQKYDKALKKLEKYKDKEDVKNTYSQCKYDYAKQLYTNEDYSSAESLFNELSYYKDSVTLREECTFMNSNNGEFLKDFASGLEARWNAVLKEEGKENTVELLIYFINLELDKVKKYKETDFDDEDFNKYVHDYIISLENSLNALGYYNVDFEEYYDLWNKSYSSRSLCISYFLKNYNVKIDKKHDETIKTFLNNADAVNQKLEFEQTIENMINTDTFVITKNSYGLRTYQITVENLTNKTFQYFGLDINLLDDNGVIIDSSSSNLINNFSPGQKSLFEFMTDKTPSTMTWSANYYVSQ